MSTITLSTDRPFSDQSWWKLKPIAPVLGTYVIPPSTYEPDIAEGPFAPAVYIASSTDGPMTISGPTGGSDLYLEDVEVNGTITIPHWPSGVVAPSGTDGHVDIIDVASNRIHSFAVLRFVSGAWRANNYSWTLYDGLGFGSPGQYAQGARAVGCVPIAGAMRTSEINDGLPMYPHALCGSMDYTGLASNPTFIFPATAADNNAGTANSGQIPEGALLMLPATMNLSIFTNPKILKVVKTLQTYGMRAVDRNTGTPFFIYAQFGSGLDIYNGSNTGQNNSQLEAIRLALRQVTSVSGWLDANGAYYNPPRKLNVLSMRGSWFVQSGTVATFDSYGQNLTFTAAGQQINNGGRNASLDGYSMPVDGAAYVYRVSATGGATLKLQVVNGSTVLYDSGFQGNGYANQFLWPSGGQHVWLSAQSPGAGQIGGTLTAVEYASTTTANFNLSLRGVSGIYSGAAIASSNSKKTLFPRRDVPVLDANGLYTEQWYRIHQFMYEVKQGGDLAPTIPQVAMSLTANQAATVAVSGTLPGIVQAIEANAASTAASIEVQVAAGTPGATQIPPPVLTVPTYTPRTNQVLE